MNPTCQPNLSPMWCNTAISTAAMNTYDNQGWYTWAPRHRMWFWYDTPMVIDAIEGNLCYRLNGNIWLCPMPQEPVEPSANIVVIQPELPPGPMGMNSHIRPSISVTSVKMDNNPEHVAVMFGQVISTLK